MKSILSGAYINETKAAITFDGADAKGRVHGISIYTYEMDTVEMTEGYLGVFYTFAPGHWFGVRIQATKDGASWGASQATNFFPTEAARAAYIAKRVNAAKEKAEK